MRVFLSWSKPASELLARSLCDWLPLVINAIEPWISSNIDAGARWSPAIAESLAETKFGIICVTRENQREPWLNFEAGACGKTLASTYVCPYLLDLPAADVVPGPLVQFQMKVADLAGTWDLIQSLHRAVRESGERVLNDAQLKRSFDTYWPTLETKIAEICKGQPASTPAPSRSDPELLREVLAIVRRSERLHMVSDELIRQLLLLHSSGIDPVVPAKHVEPSSGGAGRPPGNPVRIPASPIIYVKDRNRVEVAFSLDDREFIATFVKQPDGTIGDPILRSPGLAKLANHDGIESAARSAAQSYKAQHGDALLSALDGYRPVTATGSGQP